MTDTNRKARMLIHAVEKGTPLAKVVKEALAPEDEIAGVVGLTLDAAAGKLGDLGFARGDSTDFPSGSVTIFTAPNPENPGEFARLFVAVGSDGTVTNAQQDGTPNRDAEALSTAINQMATQLGLTRPAGSAAQPADGGTGTVAAQG